MRAFSVLNLYTEIHRADFRKLLNGDKVLPFFGQVIFEKEGEVYLTTIDDERSDYTVEDYMALPESAPFELVNGKLIYMPSPKKTHQRTSIRLASRLNLYVEKNRLGETLEAPMDVHLDKKNIYQPDILFVSNERLRILGDFVFGAPDLVVEILSPGTKKKDEGEKMKAYGKFGVREFWLIDPWFQTLEVFENQGGKMVSKSKFEKTGTVVSSIVEGFSVSLEEIFG